MSSIKNISLFVPHIFPNFDQKYVAEVFAEVGEVERVDFVSKRDRDGKPYNAAYIHFKKWFDNYPANEMQGRLETNGKTEFYHDDSQYYWIVLPNTAKKHIPGERKPRIDLGESKSISIKKIPEKLALKRSEHLNDDFELKPRNLDAEFAQFDPIASEEAMQMAEIEAELEEEGRYVACIEQENFTIHSEIVILDKHLIWTRCIKPKQQR
jgi:hypothetical protein